MARRLLSMLVLVSAVAVSLPGTALAHGPIRRGFEIDQNTKLTQSAGSVKAEWRWVTMGLRSGPVHVALTLHSCKRAAAPTCGTYVFLYHGDQVVAQKSVACYSHKRCEQTTRLRYQVHNSGVYYVEVVGLGASKIMYTLAVAGNIYPLHCQKYC